MAASQFVPPYYPIIYVRGYAGNEEEVENAVADPYMGFNLGATKVRQLWTGDVERYYFESPLVRLMKDCKYRDVYEGGEAMPPDLDLSSRSIFIYRYYDLVSSSFGTGERPEIETYAQGLNDLIEKIRDRMCDSPKSKEKFRVYLVAHSMGGLVCRCFLQNFNCGSAEARAAVDKVFTYATPHNGIDLRVVGNVPGFFSRNNANNFNREHMEEYLALSGGEAASEEKSVASLDGKFDVDRFFCLVGTNHRDYGAAHGWSSRVVGPMSDGLVRIKNATVHSPKIENNVEKIHHAPRAFVNRSHSGHYGIVNSEEGYQNLTRFLFGDVRVDGVLEIDKLTLPPAIRRKKAKAEKENKEFTLRASYHIDVVVRVRGARWDLHRRTVSENSAIFRSYEDLFERGGLARHPHLFSTFLSTGSRVMKNRKSLGFSIDLGVRVPEYEINRNWWPDDHYAGGYLYRDKINFEATPPSESNPGWRLKFGYDSITPNRVSRKATACEDSGKLVFAIPICQRKDPGIAATLKLTAVGWNR